MGKPSSEWNNDPKGKPEGNASKAVRGTVKVTAKLTKLVSQTGLIPGEWSDVVRHVADFAEKQADADPRASMWERTRLAGMLLIRIFVNYIQLVNDCSFICYAVHYNVYLSINLFTPYCNVLQYI